MEENTNNNQGNLKLFKVLKRTRVRIISLYFGLTLICFGVYYIYYELYKANLETPFDSKLAIFLFLFYLSTFLIGTWIVFQTLMRDEIDLREYYKDITIKVFHGIVNMIFISLFLVSLSYVLLIFIEPESVFSGIMPKIEETKENEQLFQEAGIRLFNTQVLISVCLGGFLGGFIRETYFRFTESRKELANVLINEFWVIIFSLLGSILISFIFFLLLRAGILKSESVDSYDLYGVVGVSIITGYFSDNALKRIGDFADRLTNESKPEKPDEVKTP